MRKIIMLIILMMTVIGCELFDAKTWEEADKRREERGVRCYRDYKGYFYCKDRDGNPYP